MIIGVPKEIKRDEYRVGLLPVGVEELNRGGHSVLIEAAPGWAPESPIKITSGKAPNWSQPQRTVRPGGNDHQGEGAPAGEMSLLRRGQIVFTYFHLAADRQLTEGAVGERLHRRSL